MRIAILSPIAWRTPPKHYGPWEQVASNLTEGLVALGFDVTLFATGDSITHAKLQSVVGAGYEEDRSYDVKAMECLHISNLIEHADEFDIIHNHFDFLPLSYSKGIKPAFVTTIHGFSSEKILPVYQKYNDNTHYISISNADRHHSLNYLDTVYNGLDTANFYFNAKPQDYLVYFGRIHPDKGTAEAISIAKKSKKRLVIAGIVQDKAYFEELVLPHLGDDISFIGATDKIKRNNLLGNALALLHPINFEEPFGLSVAEAMLCGTPVIAFNKGSMPEIINDLSTGFLVNNVDEAVNAVKSIDSINRQDCRNWAFHKFSKEKMVADYVKCYERIVQKSLAADLQIFKKDLRSF